MSKQDDQDQAKKTPGSPPPRPKRSATSDLTPPPRPKRGKASPPPRPRRSRGTESTSSPLSGSKRKLIIAGAGLLGVILMLAGVASVIGPSSTTAADYTSNEVAEIVQLLRTDPACRDTRLGNSFQEDTISLELLEAVLGQPTSKSWNGQNHVWVYQTADGTATLQPFRVFEDLGKEDETVPYLILYSGVQSIGLNSNQPVDREDLKRQVIRIKSYFDSVDGVEFERELAERIAKKEADAKERQMQQEAKMEREAKQARKEEEIRTSTRRQADTDFYDKIRFQFKSGTAEREQLLEQSKDWISRRASHLASIFESNEQWRQEPLPSRDAILAALKAGKPLPVVGKDEASNPPDKSVVTSEEPVEPQSEKPNSSDWLSDGPAGLVREYVGHSNAVFGVDFSPDGTNLLSGGEDRAVILWDIVTGEEVQRLSGFRGGARSVEFAPRSSQILAASTFSSVFVWSDLTDSKPRELKTLIGYTVLDAKFSFDGQFIAASDYGGTTIIFDSQSGKQLLRIDAHKQSLSDEDVSIRGSAISPDNRMIATASRDDTVRLWNVSDGSLSGEFTGHSSDVWCVEFSPDGQRALSGGNEGELFLWNVKSTEIIHGLKSNAVNVLSTEFLPNGRYALSSGNPKSGHGLILWDLETGKMVMSFPEQKAQVIDIDVSSDGRFAVTGGADGIVRLFRLPSEATIASDNIGPKKNSDTSKSSDTEKSREQQIAKLTEEALDKRVSLIAPYPQVEKNARKDRITVQYAVREIALQVGFQYDFETSFKNTNPACRQYIKPNIRNQKCRDALESILKPAGLTYRTDKGVIVLEKR